MSAGLDVVAHHRERTRIAERRAGLFERELARAVRLLGHAVRAAAGQECDPLTLLAAIEQLDDTVERPEPTIDKLIQVLRETDPDTMRARETA